MPNARLATLPLVLVLAAGCTPALKYEPNISVAETPVVKKMVFFTGFTDQAPAPPVLYTPNVEHRYNLVRKGDWDLRIPHYEAGAVGLNFVRELKASGLFESVEYLLPGSAPPAEPGVLVRGALHQLDLNMQGWTTTTDVTLEAVSLPEQKPLFDARRRFEEKLRSGGIAGLGKGGLDDQVHQSVRKAFGALAKELADKLSTQGGTP